MPHFKVSLDPVSIAITSAALGPDVFSTLRMARAALAAVEADEIGGIRDDLEKGILALRHAANERRRGLRTAVKAALKVREADLPALCSPEGEAGPSEPPASPEATQGTAPAEAA